MRTRSIPHSAFRVGKFKARTSAKPGGIIGASDLPVKRGLCRKPARSGCTALWRTRASRALVMPRGDRGLVLSRESSALTEEFRHQASTYAGKAEAWFKAVLTAGAELLLDSQTDSYILFRISYERRQSRRPAAKGHDDRLALVQQLRIAVGQSLVTDFHQLLGGLVLVQRGP